MQINLLFFGITRDLVGKDSMMFKLQENTTIANLKTILAEKHPELSKYDYSIAINEAYVENDALLKENDVVALIPPVSGG